MTSCRAMQVRIHCSAAQGLIPLRAAMVLTRWTAAQVMTVSTAAQVKIPSSTAAAKIPLLPSLRRTTPSKTFPITRLPPTFRPTTASCSPSTRAILCSSKTARRPRRLISRPATPLTLTPRTLLPTARVRHCLAARRLTRPAAELSRLTARRLLLISPATRRPTRLVSTAARLMARRVLILSRSATVKRLSNSARAKTLSTAST